MDWKNEHPEYRGKSQLGTLDEANVPSSPWDMWEAWLEQASLVLNYTNEIALATAETSGRPSVRMVLLKESSEPKGFCWFTNRASEKGIQLQQNPYAEILWFVKEQQRQVRVRGTVSELSRDEVIAYAQSRPRKSQISALVSAQSRSIDSKEALECATRETTKKYAGLPIPVSDEWSGFSLQPMRFEFWQGDTDRLHDRIIYTREDISWSISRLQP